MVDVDNLSDAELRSKLQEFGFPVVPITGTTRKVMTKKLKLLMENKNKAAAGAGAGKDQVRKSLGRYSSEDESDEDSKRSSRQKQLKRQTIAAPVMQPPASTARISTRKSLITSPAATSVGSRSLLQDSPPPPAKRQVKTVTTTSTTTKRSILRDSAADGFDTGSESDEVADQFDVTPSSGSSRHSPTTGGSKLASGDKRGANSSLSGRISASGSPGRLPTAFLSAASAADAASDRLTQIRSRLSQYNSSYDKPLYTSSPAEDPLQDKENTPFLSNFTRRLSQLNTESPKSSYEYKNDIIKENDANGSSARSYLSSYRLGAKTGGRPSVYDYKQTSSSLNSSIFKNNFVPLTVLIVAFLFFIVVAMVYLGIRTDTSLEGIGAVMPICSAGDNSSERFVNCLLEDEGKAALNLLKAIKPELNRRAVRNACDSAKAKPYMSELEIINFVKTNYAIKKEEMIKTDLFNLEVLAFLNPSWGISVIQFDKSGDDYRKDMIVQEMKKVNEDRHFRTTGLIMQNPSVPWGCYLSHLGATLFSLASTLIGGVVILYAISYGYKSYKNYRERQREEDVAMVENIVDVLQSNAGGDGDDNNFLVINHVRDMILPISERRSKEKTWARAVKYIADNESRIRTEIQVVRGEPSEVWRWLGGANLSNSKNKSWQGQAFETQVGSVNSLPCSPTPCLKIRGMVKEGERANTQAIKKAVLSKCASECKILHCALDASSNCVYLKCADPSDAAVAYRNLHGWWYAGNLVTVKYLRLERYMQRYPDSSVSGPPYLK